MIDCVKFVGDMQGVRVRVAFMSKLVGNGGKDTGLGLSFLELLRAEKVATQDGVLVVVGNATLLKSFSYGICNGGFARASLTSQPEDTRAGR